ncbi:MAG: HDIG domain-containing protein [Candidatus Borkfalkiaceae bacterium]|nr:HDIG domain-containing protein [Christensenellaceae bacterium]
MDNKGSKKLLPWGKKDVIGVTAVYVVNLFVLAGLFIAAVFFNGRRGGQPFAEYFSSLSSFFSFLVVLVLLIGVMALFFLFESRDFLRSPANSEMLFLIMEAGLFICYVCGNYINPYVRPLAFVAVTTLFLVNSRTAVFMNFVFCILTFLFDAFSGSTTDMNGYSVVFFLVMGAASGIIAVYVLADVYSRGKLLALSFPVSLPVLICIALPMIEFGSEGDRLITLLSGFFSGPLSIASFLILLPFFESVFKKVTCFKYAELTDHKAKYIRKLIEQAPGTFNHAIVVSNIAEACATAIGEDALLARTCAYYHDIGKLRRPEFFKENQADGENPHDDLTPELSANIIKSHTQDGYSLAKKARLPEEIARVCLEHHGTLPIWYFYAKAKKFTDGEVPILQYCYPGPKPQSKISAIIMIADGCEAAARSLKDRSREKVNEAVKKIVSDRMQLGQFDECELTIKEINIIINTVVNRLTGVYHKRIEYPTVSLEGIDVKKEEADLQSEEQE